MTQILKILKAILIALAACGQAAVFGDGDAKIRKKPKVAIIGAGLAGLTAAYRLQQYGFDVAVYEAKNRVGGRIFSVLIEGQASELGGSNLLDGGDAENTRMLAKELGIELEEKRYSIPSFYFSDGKWIDFNESLQSKRFDPESLRTQVLELSRKTANMKEVLKGLFDAPRLYE